MRFEEALLLAGKGQLITRPGYGVSFAAIREGQAVYGQDVYKRQVYVRPKMMQD